MIDIATLPEWVIYTVVSLALWPLIQILRSIISALGFFFYSSGNLKKYGDWVIVTGATDGIGKGYAKQFAKRKLNVVLISRSEDKLKETAEEIKKLGVDVKTIAVDFSSTDDATYNRIAEGIKGLNIGILVNNVGISYPHAQFLNEIEDSLVKQLIDINVFSLTKMTKLVLPSMIEKKKGVIINVGSAAGLIPIGDPLYAVYSGTKAYVDFFSRSLNIEMKRKGIIVENHVPYFVVSKLSKIRRPSIAVPNENAYAAAAISKIGYGPTVVPFPIHAIQHWIIMNAPTWFVSWYVWGHHYGIYKKAMSKKKAQ